MGLKEYVRKRNFNETSEPQSGSGKSKEGLKFVVQRHHASHLHYDFRLELEGVLKSWAVPKGPSLNPKDKRLAMMVEDHPYDYRTFEGVIPAGNYGAGMVTIFDEGTYESLSGKNDEKELKKGLYSGNLKFRLNGKLLKGEFALVKIKNSEDNSWLLIKHRDEYAVDKKFDSESFVPEEIKRKGSDIKKKAKTVMPEESVESGEPEVYRHMPVSKTLTYLPGKEQEWIYERKIKGERVLVYTGDSVKITPVEGTQVGDFGKLNKELKPLKNEAVIDGVIADEGKTKKVLYAFDLIMLDGHELKGLELVKRKKLLQALVEKLEKPAVVYNEDYPGPLNDVLKRAEENQWYGVIAKQKSGLYYNSNYDSAGADEQWVEIKRAEEIKDQKKMKKSSAGHTQKDKSAKSGDAGKPEKKAGELEESFGRKKVKLTNLDKLYWKKEKISKGDLLDYYRQIADYILPYLKDRPLSLNRHPNGIEAPGFFQKDLDVEQIPTWIKYAPLFSESNNKDIDYLICNDLPTLLWMVNLGCIEINPWLSTYKKPENPVFAVMDLDPNDVDDFTEVVRVALTARDILEQMGIRPYIKTSGSRGLHIFIHPGAKYDYEIVKNFIHYLGQFIHSQHPDTTSLERSPSKRKKKIYLDFLQNRRGQTIAAPYSARPKPGATVSTPLEWDEVNESLDIKKFTIFNTLERLREKGDLWKDITSDKADLKAALKK